MPKKRAFVKYTKKGKLIAGSLIVTTAGGYPIDGLYTEVPTNICCDEDTPGTITSSPKGWVRYTKKGAIVPGSLIIGKSHPNDGIWKEVTVDLCCSILSNWYLRYLYDYAINPGDITFPDQANQTASLNPNLVGDLSGSTLVVLYINVFDIKGVDRTDLVGQMVGNYGRLTLTQGTNSVTYEYTDQAFYYTTVTTPNDNVGFDYFYLPSQVGSLTLLSPASGDFNLIDPITVAIEVLPPPPPPPPPNLTLKIINNNFDIPAYTGDTSSDFTIEWWAKMTADDNHPRAFSIGSYLTGGARHAVSIENGTLYYWANGSVVTSVGITGHLTTWTHFCIMRRETILFIFKDGVQITYVDNFANAIPTNGLPLYLGSEGDDSKQNGTMSNFRWNNTVVYDVSGFILPTAPLTSISGTKLLIFQGNDLPQEITDNSGMISSIDIVNGSGGYYYDNPFTGTEGSILFGVTPISNVKINGVTWSTKNLDVTVPKYGTLTYCANATEWQAANAANLPAYCYPDYDPANGPIYGALYNYFAVPSVTPDGWNVSGTGAYSALSNLFGYLESTYGNSGGVVKEVGTTHWLAPNTAATDVVGFTGLPAGYVDSSGTYGFLGQSGCFWGNDYSFPNLYSFFTLGYNISSALTGYFPVSHGLSIRVYHN